MSRDVSCAHPLCIVHDFYDANANGIGQTYRRGLRVARSTEEALLEPW